MPPRRLCRTVPRTARAPSRCPRPRRRPSSPPRRSRPRWRPRRWSAPGRRKPEPQRARGSGALPLAQHLTRAVIDRRDVIGVKRVPQAERVGQHRYPDPEPLVMRGHHEHEQDDEPGHVQARDHPVHRDQPGSLPGGHRRERLPYQPPDVRQSRCARGGAAGGNAIRSGIHFSCRPVSAEDAECEPRRAAPLHQRRHLVPVDMAGGSFGHWQGDARRASRATRHSCTGSCFSMVSWRPGGSVSSIVFLRPLDLTVDKRHGQFHGRGESSLLFLEQPAHVFHVLHCLGGIHCRRPFPIMCLLPT